MFLIVSIPLDSPRIYPCHCLPFLPPSPCASTWDYFLPAEGTPFIISFRVSLLVKNYFSFCLKVPLFSIYLANFTYCKILGWQLFSSSILKLLSHSCSLYFYCEVSCQFTLLKVMWLHFSLYFLNFFSLFKQCA